MTAAKLGFQTVAVEPMPRCVEKIAEAVRLGGTGDLVTIINAAVSNKTSSMYMMVDRVNKGGSFISTREGCISHDSITCNLSEPIKTITTDDLLPVVNFTNVVIKVDAEGTEPEVFSHAEKLFSERNVIAVEMEWHLPLSWWQDQDPQGIDKSMHLIDFFKSRSYTACSAVGRYRILKWTDWPQWPEDVLFIHDFYLEKIRKSNLLSRGMRFSINITSTPLPLNNIITKFAIHSSTGTGSVNRKGPVMPGRRHHPISGQQGKEVNAGQEKPILLNTKPPKDDLALNRPHERKRLEMENKLRRNSN